MRFVMAALFALTLPTLAVARDLPDLTGQWSVHLEGVKLQKDYGEAPENADQAPPESGLFELDMIVVIEEQDGHGFIGTKTSDRASERISGIVDFDHEHVFMVDHDGSTACLMLTPARMRCIYVEVNAENSIAGRQTWRRQSP